MTEIEKLLRETNALLKEMVVLKERIFRVIDDIYSYADAEEDPFRLGGGHLDRKYVEIFPVLKTPKAHIRVDEVAWPDVRIHNLLCSTLHYLDELGEKSPRELLSKRQFGRKSQRLLHEYLENLSNAQAK